MFLIKFQEYFEKMYSCSRAFTKFYNSDDVNATAAELRQTKARPFFLSMTDDLLY